MKNLVIVESPAKAKTIEKFLDPSYQVESCYGHIRDLVKKDMGIDIEGGFVPHYEIPIKNKKTVSKLRDMTKKSTMVWLATDEDREGEAIAWHLKEVFKLEPERMKRITFNEITKQAVQKAIANPRNIDQALVNAQQARRIIDRLVGFELSPVLWRKVKGGLSAGRVQSVAVRLVIEREQKRTAFESKKSWKIEAFLVTDPAFKAAWSHEVEEESTVLEILKSLSDGTLTVSEIESKEGKRSPSAPFTTSSLQQTAAQLLGFSLKRTMSAAQRLYEAGAITYMRTDSLNLSEQALEDGRGEIERVWGEKYHKRRQFKSKLSSAQEAHEAIRPTSFSVHEVTTSEDEKRLYRIIWQRTIASQMSDAKISRTKVKLTATGLKGNFESVGEQVLFDGWLRVWPNKQKETLLPNLSLNDALPFDRVEARETFSRPPAHYTESSLVKELENLGIGRPSTYAPTISTIQERGYIEKKDIEGRQRPYKQLILNQGEIEEKPCVETTGADKKVLISTDIAIIVNDFLLKQFQGVIDYQFTARLEQSFDNIANSQEDWKKMIESFYQPFHLQINEAQSLEHQQINQGRELGTHPDSGELIIARMGKYGPLVQVGSKEAGSTVSYAGLRPHQRLDTINLAEALELFDMPKEVGEAPKEICYRSIDGSEYKVEAQSKIVSNVGRFGPYLQYGERKYVSIKGMEPESIDLDTALQVIDAHLKKQSEQLLAFFGDIKVLQGRFSPYLSDGSRVFSLDKKTPVDTLDEDSAKLLLSEKGKPIKQKAKSRSKSKSRTKK